MLTLDRHDEARAVLDPAIAVVEDLGSLREIERGRALLSRLEARSV
jgi:hypothetical protein